LFIRTSRRVELTAVGRQLYDDLRPARNMIDTAMQRAIDAGRGFTGTLRAGFLTAAGSQLLAGAGELFRRRHPECGIHLREVQLGSAVAALRAGEVDVLLASFPFDESGLVMGPVLIAEAPVLAVPSGHPIARAESVSLEDLTRLKLLQPPGTLPESWRIANAPASTPAGRPIEPGPTAATLQELLSLVGIGRGACLVGAHTRRYYVRPDVVYLPIRDAPPVRWGLVWLAGAGTARVRAFEQAAREVRERDK
jgi:DNA-binding transcriptional LysR family regulator